MPNCRENPKAFLDGLLSNPIDMNVFRTEDGEGFVYSAIETALDALRTRDAEKYVSQLNGVGYDVKWKAPVIIDPID